VSADWPLSLSNARCHRLARQLRFGMSTGYEDELQSLHRCALAQGCAFCCLHVTCAAGHVNTACSRGEWLTHVKMHQHRCKCNALGVIRLKDIHTTWLLPTRMRVGLSKIGDTQVGYHKL
jgi:hypothetical protein